MDAKEATTQIILKMLETNALTFDSCSSNFPSDKIAENNQKRVETICNAYKTVYQTVAGRAE